MNSTSPYRLLQISPSCLLRLLQQCQILTIRELKQIHAHAITHGLARFSFVSSKILAAICSLPPSNTNLHYAQTLFTLMPTPNIFDYNTLINSHFHNNNNNNNALSLFIKMLNTTVLRPNSHTFTALLRACVSLSSLQQVHAQAMKLGNSSDFYVVSSVLTAYSKHGAIHLARRVFDESSNRNVVCWTSLLSGYCTCGFVKEARDLFDVMPQRNDASYSAMVSGYVNNGWFIQGIELFRELKGRYCKRVKPSGLLLVSVLNACTAVGAFKEGKWIHSYIEENGLEYELELGTALIDFYAKCGWEKVAEEVFDKMAVKDVATWSAMILGLAVNGNNQMALELFGKMEKKVGPKPNEATFIGVLTACNHKNLFGQVWRLFGVMSERYGITPSIEHYGCVVDVLARSGQIREAFAFIKSMPMEPDGVIWGCLLNGCLVHGYFELGLKVGKYLIEFEPEHSGRYVLLANMYANMGWWEGVSEVRKLMKDRGVSAISAWSFIEIDQTIHRFVAGDKYGSNSREIYQVLIHLGKKDEDFSRAEDG